MNDIGKLGKGGTGGDGDPDLTKGGRNGLQVL